MASPLAGRARAPGRPVEGLLGGQCALACAGGISLLALIWFGAESFPPSRRVTSRSPQPPPPSWHLQAGRRRVVFVARPHACEQL
jgi:hypothetical protein